MHSYRSKLMNLFVNLHTTFHFNNKSDQLTFFRGLYLTFNLQLIVLLLQKESSMDIVQFVQQINVNITYMSNPIAFLVVHLIILITLAIGINQKLHTLNHTTFYIYYYILSIPIFKNCIDIHLNKSEIIVKFINLIIQAIILITIVYFKRSEDFIERNIYLQNIRNRFFLYLEQCLVLVILIVNQVWKNQEFLNIIFISKMIFTIINTDYLHQSSQFVAGSSLQFLAIAIFIQGNSINLLSGFLLGIVLINIYRQVTYWKFHNLISKPCENYIQVLIFLEDNYYCKNKYGIQHMLIKLQLKKNGSTTLIEEIIKMDADKYYTIQITNYLVNTQLIRGLNYLKLNIYNKFYHQITKLSIERKYNQQIIQTDSALTNQYHAYCETEITKLEIIKDVIKAKIQFYRQLKSFSINQQVLYLNCKLLGECISRGKSIKFGKPTTFHQFKFLELYYQLIMNNKIEAIKYGIEAAKSFIRDSIDINLEQGKSIFLSSDYETLGKIQTTDSIQRFFQNSQKISHIKQIMPEFIAERHDELLKQFLLSGDSALLQSNLPTFYSIDNQFIQPCKIQQFMTQDYAHMHIIFTKEYNSNSYIIFDTNGYILEYTQDMDVSRGEIIFNYINIKQNILLLKQQIIQQNLYKLDNLLSELYWFNPCNRKVNEQIQVLQQLDWPLLNLNIKIKNQDLNREINYSLQYQVFNSTKDQFSYFVIQINNEIDNESSQSSSTVKLANFISQINLKSEPKFIATKINTQQYGDFKNNQTFLNSPMNSQTPLQFNKTSKPLFNAQQSECSSISGRKHTLINLFSNCRSFVSIRNLKVILTIFISIFISYCMVNVFLMRSLLNLQIIDLNKVTHVQLLNYGLLREFFTKYINLEIKHQYLHLEEELSLFLLKKEQEIIEYNYQTTTKNSIQILKQNTQPFIIIDEQELNIFEFYNMFYQDLKQNLQGNYSERYIVEFIKYNDENIDIICTQVELEFLEIKNPLLTIALIYIGLILILQIYFYLQLRVTEHYYSLIMICIVNIEEYVIIEELQILEKVLLKLQQWTKINFEDYENKILQHHSSLTKQQKSLVYELEIPRTRVRNYIVMLIITIISVSMIVAGYLFLLSQINQFEYYFQLNYRSVQLQQHFMATSTMGEIIKTNDLMFKGHEVILIDLFVDHFSYELPYQIADIYQYLLKMNADMVMQQLVTDDLCQLIDLQICKSIYSEIVNLGIQGFDAQYFQMILTDFQFENKSRTFENNITNQIGWINTDNNKKYFIYYILDVSETIQDLIQYSYDFIDQKYAEIDWLLFLYFFCVYMVVIILIGIFVYRWIEDEENQLIKFRSILKIIPEESQQKSIININIRRLLRESI